MLDVLADPLHRRIFEHIDVHADDTLSLLRQLVRTPGLSGQEGSADDPDSVVGILAGTLAARGTVAHHQPVSATSQNIVEVLRGEGERAFLIEAHTDTVGVGDLAAWHQQDPYGAFDGEVEYLGDGAVNIHVGSATYPAQLREQMSSIWERRPVPQARILYGRGAYDNKSSVVAMWAAIRALDEVLRSEGVRLGGDLLGAYCVSEETDAAGVRALAVGDDSWLVEQGYVQRCDGRPQPVGDLTAVVLEGSYGWAPVVGHRGGAQMLLRGTGHSSHAATPHMGHNAVLSITRALQAIEDGTPELIERLNSFLDPELLGAATIATGTTIVGGGIQRVHYGTEGVIVEREDVNAIPAWCEASIDVRYPADRTYPRGTAELPERIRRTIDEFLSEALPSPDRDHVRIEHLTNDLPCILGLTWDEAEQHPLVRGARQTAQQLLGYDPGLAIAPGSTDATFLAHGSGIPTLAEIGPAGALSHQPHEFVETEQIHLGAKVLAAMAISHLGIVDNNTT